MVKRIEAVERIAHGVVCEDCETIFPVRSQVSKPPGYYINAVRVTEGNVMRKSEGELFFCSQECMLHSLKYAFSHLVTERIFDEEHPKPRSYGG